MKKSFGQKIFCNQFLVIVLLISTNDFFCLVFSAIGRTLIPRYFRSIFEGGVTELYYNLKHPKESFHNTSITLDCEQCSMITHHGKPMFTKVGFNFKNQNFKIRRNQWKK